MACGGNGSSTQPWRDLEEVNVVVTANDVVINTTQIVDVGTFQRVAGATSTAGLHLSVSPPTATPSTSLAPPRAVARRGVGRRGSGVGAFTAAACA